MCTCASVVICEVISFHVKKEIMFYNEIYPSIGC